MAKRTIFPNCCSLYIVSDIPHGTVKEVIEQCKDTGVPLVFVDNLSMADHFAIGTTRNGDKKTLGGMALAEGLRKEGYRVDEIAEFIGAHAPRKVRMWLWYSNKNSVEGKKPSRMLKDEKNTIRDSKSGPDAGPRTKGLGIG